MSLNSIQWWNNMKKKLWKPQVQIHSFIIENDTHCVKCVQMQSFFSSVFSRIRTKDRDTKYLSVFSLNAGKYGPEKTPYLDTFHAVTRILKFIMFHSDNINSAKMFKRILRKIEWDSIDKLVYDTRANFCRSYLLHIQSKFWKFLQNLMPLVRVCIKTSMCK